MPSKIQIAIGAALVATACTSDAAMDDDGGGGGAGGAAEKNPEGSFLIAMSMNAAPTRPFVARATTRRADAPALFYVQQHVFVDAGDRVTPVGPTAVYVYGPEGQAKAELTAPAAANPITDGDALIDVLFTLTELEPFACGTTSGMMTSDGVQVDIAGSTFAMTPLESADPSALVVDCDGTVAPLPP